METNKGSKDDEAKSDGNSRVSTTRGEMQQRKSEIISKLQICVNETKLRAFLSKIGARPFVFGTHRLDKIAHDTGKETLVLRLQTPATIAGGGAFL